MTRLTGMGTGRGTGTGTGRGRGTGTGRVRRGHCGILCEDFRGLWRGQCQTYYSKCGVWVQGSGTAMEWGINE